MNNSSLLHKFRLGQCLIGMTIGIAVVALTSLAYLLVDKLGPSMGSSTQQPSATHRTTTERNLGEANKSPRAGYDLPQLSQYGTDFSRTVALLELIDGSSEEELQELLDMSRNISRTSIRNETVTAIAQKLTALKFPNILELVEHSPDTQRGSLVTGVFRELSLRNLDESQTLAMDLDESSRRTALETILETRSDLSADLREEIAANLGDTNYAVKSHSENVAMSLIDRPDEAWHALTSDDVDNAYQIRMLEQIGSHWIERDGLDVLPQIATSLSANYGFEVQALIVSRFSERDPAQAFDAMQSLPQDEKRAILPIVARTWAQKEPEKAFEAAASLDDFQYTESVVRAVVEVWAALEPEAAYEAANALDPTNSRNSIVKRVVLTWARNQPKNLIEKIELFDREMQIYGAERAVATLVVTNPKDALLVLESLDSKIGDTSTISRAMGREWSKHDPSSALEWILSESQRENSQRLELLEEALSSLVHEDPHRAFDLALQQPLEWENANGMESIVLREISRVDIETAIDLLPQVRKGSIRMSVMWIGGELVEGNEPLRAIDLAKLLTGDARENYLLGIGYKWSETHPIQLYRMLEQLPNEKLRSMMASKLVESNARNPVLSDAQIDRVKTYVSSNEEH